MKVLSKIAISATLMAGLLTSNPSHAFSLDSLPAAGESKRYFNAKNDVESIFGFERTEIGRLLEECRIEELDNASNRDGLAIKH